MRDNGCCSVSSTTTTTPNSKVSSRGSSKHAALLPSLSDNNDQPPPRRPESRDVTSRYLSAPASSMTSSSSSSSMLSLNSVCIPRRRLQSTTNHVTPASPVNNKRDQSMEGRRSGETKTSARSLSVSFQGESFALPVSKVAKPGNNGLRNGTPERRKTVATPVRTSENSQQARFMMMSVDFTNEKMKFSRSGTASAVRVLRKSLIADKTVNKLVSDSENSDHAISDTDSISSGSATGNVRGVRRAIVVPARFWQETINLLRRVQPEPVSSSRSKSNKCKFLDGGRKISAKGSPSFPARGVIPAISSSKRAISWSTDGNALGCNDNLGNTASIQSFSRRGKVGEKKVVDAHLLRLMHNKHLQWRFANAKVDAAMLVQQATAKKSLYNAWVTISKIWHSVISKRVEMQQLKQNLKLHSILKKQMSDLDNWDLTDGDLSISLSGAIGALESSSLCLPVLCGAKADIHNLKDAICSAFDVMQAITVSICSLVNKVEHVNSLASELASATKTECCLLDQCKDLFITLTLMEVQDCSLRTHTLQLMPTI